MTGGLVTDARHIWLPTITPLTCALLSLAAMAPALAHVWRDRRLTVQSSRVSGGSCMTRKEIAPDKSTKDEGNTQSMAVAGALGASGDRPCMLHLVTVCSLAAFLFGYHVHEKALLHAAVSVSPGLGFSVWGVGFSVWDLGLRVVPGGG